jgi:hypothetical protein
MVFITNDTTMNKIYKSLVLVITILSSTSAIAAGTATGANKVYVEQIGNSNTITIEQIGGTNNVGGTTGSSVVASDGVTTYTPAAPSSLNYGVITGSTNILQITQHGNNDWAQYNIKGNNNSYTSTITGDDNQTVLIIGDANFSNNNHDIITETITGNSNLSITNVIGNYITSTLTVAGDSNQITQNLKSTNGTSTIAITGNSNVLNSEQIDAAGSAGHSLTQSISGDYNSITTQQQGSNDTTIDIVTAGDNNTVTIRSSSSSIVDPQSAISR